MHIWPENKRKGIVGSIACGINDVYKGVRGNIRMSRNLPYANEVYYMLLQEEHQSKMSSKVHLIPQSIVLNSNYSSCNSSQDSLGLMG